MPRKSFNDRTFFKHDKKQKEGWKRAAKVAKSADLSDWIRTTLDLSVPPKPNA